MEYKYKLKNKEELIKVIKKEIYEVQGTKNRPNWKADLNCIDTSLITDMSELFSDKYNLEKFDGNISQWNVSNVTNMEYIFGYSQFNQDISNWDVSNVENMSWMFVKSEFNQPIGNWNISNAEDISHMFAYSKFNQPIGNWNISNVVDMSYMFIKSEFNQDISKWDVSNVENISWMFAESKFNKDISKWNIYNIKEMECIFSKSKFNKDIGNWPESLKKELRLENISVSDEYPKLPDEVKYPQTIANIFNYVIKNPTSKEITKNQAINILTEWMNNRQKEYLNKGFNKKTLKQILTNDFLDILKNIDNKEKFLKILKENKMDINLEKGM